MAYELTLMCSFCGKRREFDEKGDYYTNISIADAVKQVRWIGQQNGENFDIYCSKACDSGETKEFRG